MLPAKLERELEALRERFAIAAFEEPDAINVVISAFPTAPQYNAATTTLLLRVPRAYPDAALDMFWTDPSLTFANGAIPQAAESIETYCGRPWRRFSWHHNGWMGSRQSIDAYLEFVTRRFRATS